MDAKTRASLAEQLLANPLFDELFAKQEKDAVELMVYATDDKTRFECAMRVQAVRTLRRDCQQYVGSTRERKAAPA